MPVRIALCAYMVTTMEIIINQGFPEAYFQIADTLMKCPEFLNRRCPACKTLVWQGTIGVSWS